MNRFAKYLVLASFVSLSPAAFAGDKEMKDSPCAPVFDSCKNAGFVKGENAPDGKDLWDDCKEPLLNGDAVAGVAVDSKSVSHCKKFKADKEQWVKQWKEQNKQ